MIINPPPLPYLSKYSILEIHVRISLPLDQQVAGTVLFDVPVTTAYKVDWQRERTH